MRISSILEPGLFVVVLSLSGVIGSTSVAHAQTDWGTNATAHRGKNGQRLYYVCPAGGRSGYANVYGTDLYTDDSAICMAAVHAGVISFAAGGTVTIEIRPGAASYTGSVRNGVSSQNYGGWQGSFGFVGATPPPQTNRPPNAPTLLSPPNTYAPGVSPYSVTLQWQNNGDPDGDPLSFEIQVYLWEPSTREWRYVSRYTGNGTYLTIPGGSAPQTYYAWRVFAMDGNKRSNPWYAVSAWSVYYTNLR